MKKMTKISLHNLSQAELAEKEQKFLKGGYDLPCVCIVGCACKYAGPQEGPDDPCYGGSSTGDNSQANGGNYQASGHVG